MIELNLIPDVKIQFVRAQRVRRQVVSSVIVGGIVVVGLVVLFALYVYVWQPVRGLAIDNGIKDSSKKLADVKDLDQYLSIQNQLSSLNGLHESKTLYSRMLEYLPTLNPVAPNNIRITRLIANQDAGTMTIDAYASTYAAVSVFQTTMNSAQFTYTPNGDTQAITIPLFDSVAIGNTSIGQDATGKRVVTFTITANVSTPVFAFTSEKTSIAVPTKNATGSIQNVPEVFGSATSGSSGQ